MTEKQLQGEGDRFLIEEVRAGSADAFRRLVDRFSGRLRAFAARRLTGAGIDPEDAVQETFLSLVRNLNQLSGIRSLQAYLFTILRCRIVDLLRARGPAGRALPLQGSESTAGLDPPSPEGTPSSYARRNEAAGAQSVVIADVLDGLLSRLKAERRFRDLKVLELIFCSGKSHQEVARLVGTSEPTVSRTWRGALEDLRRLAERHPQWSALEDLPAADPESGSIAELISTLWHENLFSCIKRSTLGDYALGVLDEPEWTDYIRFHLETARCEYCAAHLADITAGGGGISTQARERIFASSIGFLRR